MHDMKTANMTANMTTANNLKQGCKHDMKTANMTANKDVNMTSKLPT